MFDPATDPGAIREHQRSVASLPRVGKLTAERLRAGIWACEHMLVAFGVQEQADLRRHRHGAQIKALWRCAQVLKQRLAKLGG